MLKFLITLCYKKNRRCLNKVSWTSKSIENSNLVIRACFFAQIGWIRLSNSFEDNSSRSRGTVGQKSILLLNRKTRVQLILLMIQTGILTSDTLIKVFVSNWFCSAIFGFLKHSVFHKIYKMNIECYVILLYFLTSDLPYYLRNFGMCVFSNNVTFMSKVAHNIELLI